MEQLEILKILNRYNPWWENKPIPPSKISPFKRGDFYFLKKSLERREISSIMGPRRVGKTILMHQLIQHLIESKVDPKRIVYLSIDEVELNRGGADLKDILETYSKYVIQKPLDALQETHYLFLDEIQELPDWAAILKNWYDLGYKLKFFISGSSSIWISKGTEESLLGRIKISLMLPLKFSEVLKYRLVIPDDFFKTRLEVLDSLALAIEKDDPEIFKSALLKFIGSIGNKKELIEIELNRYMIVGGYPEFLDEKDYRKIGEAVRDKIRLIFFKDIVRYFRIRNPEVLEDLFKLLAKNSGSPFNLAKTAELLDIQRPTLRDYLKYLSKAYLIKSSEFYSLSRRKRIRKQEKIYVLDPGIRNGILGFIDDTLLKEEIELGIIAEGILFDHLVRLKFNLEPGPEPEIFYWKDSKEIDFVLQVKRKPIPVESKFRNRTPEEVLKVLEEFADQNKSPFGIIVTKDIFNTDGRIIKIPLWVFLLMI